MYGYAESGKKIYKHKYEHQSELRRIKEEKIREKSYKPKSKKMQLR